MCFACNLSAVCETLKKGRTFILDIIFSGLPKMTKCKITKNKEKKRAGHLSVKTISCENSLRKFVKNKSEKGKGKIHSRTKAKAV